MRAKGQPCVRTLAETDHKLTTSLRHRNLHDYP